MLSWQRRQLAGWLAFNIFQLIISHRIIISTIIILTVITIMDTQTWSMTIGQRLAPLSLLPSPNPRDPPVFNLPPYKYHPKHHIYESLLPVRVCLAPVWTQLARQPSHFPKTAMNSRRSSRSRFSPRLLSTHPFYKASTNTSNPQYSFYILQDENWGETTTAVTNVSELDYAMEDLSKWQIDNQRSFQFRWTTHFCHKMFIKKLVFHNW